MLLPTFDSYEEIHAKFKWSLPARYNCAADICDRHVSAGRGTALTFDRAEGVTHHSYAELQKAANGLANVLAELGLQRGDRVAIVAQPAFAVAVTHVACWKSGLVSCAMATLFACDALTYRFAASGAKAVVTDRDNLEKVSAAAREASGPKIILVIDGAAAGCLELWPLVEAAPKAFTNVDTRANEPAFINFTSGTTGQPKGVLAPHSAVPAQAAAMEFLYDFPEPGEVLWSPADWAWLAGQTCVLTTGLFLGMSVVARPRAGFDALDAFRLMSQHGVTRTLLVPTMMKLMRQVPVEQRVRYPLQLKSIATGGEPVGPALYDWCRSELGASLSEAYGQTECSTMLIHNTRMMGGPIGCLGKAAPGLVAGIVDDAGNELPAGAIGQIAVRTPHPIVFLEYWNNPDATAAKFAEGWMLTGDLGYRDEDGYFWFKGRADDVITSSGYRIGPGEVEDVLLRHPAVAMAAVIGVPDPVRTEAVAAFVVLADGVMPSESLAEEIRAFVREHLARHEVPRTVRFVDALPTTTTGKIMRKTVREQVLAGEM